MYSSCGSAYGSYADYYRSYFGNNYPHMGYGQSNGCSCSACANSTGGSYAGYPYGSDSCCGGGFAAGPGLYDSRCFIPISTQALGCPLSISVTSPLGDDAQVEDGTIVGVAEGLSQEQMLVIEEPYIETCEETQAFGGSHNAGEMSVALCGRLHKNLVPLDSMDAHTGMRLDDDGVKVEHDGTYEIRLFGNFSYSDNSYIEWHVSADDQVLNSTTASMNAYANEMRTFERTAILALKAGSVLRIHAAPEEKGTLYVRPSGVSITLKKLSN